MVHANRSQEAAHKLIGGFSGKLITDCYNAYNFYKLLRRICWAHLKRDFKTISEAKGAVGKCKLSGKCRSILKDRKHLWTFVKYQSVYWRCVRPAVCRSEALSNTCVMRVVVIWTVFLLRR